MTLNDWNYKVEQENNDKFRKKPRFKVCEYIQQLEYITRLQFLVIKK